jgi:hypothetical protein
MNGSYTFADTPATDATTPKNPYSSYLNLEYDQTYGSGSAPLPPMKHNLKTGTQVPVEIVAEVDRKIDDGLPYNGGFQFSAYPAGGTAPSPSGPQGCVVATGTPQVWDIKTGSTNCGAASLF